MPEIQIGFAAATDLPVLMNIDHSSMTEYVWQMDVHREAGQVGVVFREIRLPRAVPVRYPRPVAALADSWSRQASILVARNESAVIGYIRCIEKIIPQTAWITDLVVSSDHRRQGVGTSLIMAAHSRALELDELRMVLEIPSKNYPAMCLAQKLGYEFCGYNDQYYETQDIALFFGRSLL